MEPGRERFAEKEEIFSFYLTQAEKKFIDNHINVRIITGEITYNLIVNKNMKVKEMLMIFSQKFRFPYKESADIILIPAL